MQIVHSNMSARIQRRSNWIKFAQIENTAFNEYFVLWSRASNPFYSARTELKFDDHCISG